MEDKEKQAEQMWGNTDEYKEFKDKKLTNQQLLNSGEQLMQMFKDIGKLKDINPEAKEVQDKIQELKTFITNHYYTCTNKTLKALGEMYITDAFKANIDRAGGEGTALYTHEAINAYLKQQEVETTLDEETNTVLAYIDNKQVGECVYVITKEEINIVHTEVDEDYQGKGIAGKLVDRVITYAEEQNKRIVADCSYAKNRIEKRNPNK